MSTLRRGILIAIEGIDGSGKSTLVHNLAPLLIAQDLSTITTKEPGGSSLGKQLRTLLQCEEKLLDPKAEYLLFAADRAQHFYEVILPNLEAKKIIISDRMADSSLVYQGHAQDVDISMIKTINTWVMSQKEPDIVIFLHIDPMHARKRIQQRAQPLSSFEKDSLPFTRKLVEGFDIIFKNRINVIHLDGNQSPEIVAKQAFDHIITWIQQHHLINQ